MPYGKVVVVQVLCLGLKTRSFDYCISISQRATGQKAALFSSVEPDKLMRNILVRATCRDDVRVPCTLVHYITTSTS